MEKKFKNIAIIGKSPKFIKIIYSLFSKSCIQKYSWRSITSLKLNDKLIKNKPDLIFICGYDYQSYWYSFKRYYDYNISAPLRLVKFLKKKNTLIIYIDTANKVKSQRHILKRSTFSRYEYAKKELGYNLYKNFDNLKILSVPIIKDNKNKAEIYGNIITKKLFNFLIYINLVNSINTTKLKRLIKNINLVKKNYKPVKLKPLNLKIPRSLMIDRILRFIHG
tara:strand:+ start:792 stop:1457 length:666 start_codon:yes stop_codon:yes gene_type:complete